MEELLNKLIEKGWKPRWENVELYWTSEDTFWEKVVIFNGNAGWFKKWWCTYRELVSKESWLWQFVCENGLVEMYEWFYWQNIFQLDSKEYDYTDYQYWILESSLKNESELEDFLLENIKV